VAGISLEVSDPRFLTRLPDLHTLTATFALGDELPKNWRSYRASPAGLPELLGLDGKDSVLRQQVRLGYAAEHAFAVAYTYVNRHSPRA
jgi:hypothetical protein